MNLAKTSFWITLLLVVGYIIAFVKESFIANYFGVSNFVDAYNIAIQIPVIIFSLVSVAIKSVVIPVYSDIYYNKSIQEANKFASSFITLNILIACAIFFIGETLAGPCIYLFAPGFDASTHDIAVSLLRITFPTIVFTVVTDIITGILNVHKKLVLPCAAVYLLQLSVILMIVFFHAKWGISAACIGQVVGSILQMTYLYVIARKIYQYRIRTNFKNVEVVKALKMSGPVIWGISIAEVNAMINRMVGSFLFVGSISALGYAGKINSVFLAFCVNAISIVVFPLYAEASAKNDMAQLNRRVNFTLTVNVLLLMPLMCLVFCLREEIIEVAFARGAFDKNAVTLTQGILGCYTIGLLFSAFRETLTKVFYSMKNTSVVAKNATMGVLLNIALNLSLPWFLGVKGLALGASCSVMFISIRLLWLLTQKVENIKLSYFYKNLKVLLFASALVFIILFFFRNYALNMTAIIRLGLATVITVFVYSSVLLFAKPDVVCDILKYVKK